MVDSASSPVLLLPLKQQDSLEDALASDDWSVNGMRENEWRALAARQGLVVPLVTALYIACWVHTIQTPPVCLDAA